MRVDMVREKLCRRTALPFSAATCPHHYTRLLHSFNSVKCRGTMCVCAVCVLREVLQALRSIKPRVAVFTSVPIAGSHARSAPPGG